MFLTIKLGTHAELYCLKKELIICIKMDLALDNPQRLICHKPKNQHNYSLYIYIYVCVCVCGTFSFNHVRFNRSNPFCLPILSLI